MSDQCHKKYTNQAKSGIRGEALFELLLSDHALTHRIVGSKDVGIDFICEWSHGDRPSGILFAVQVKSFFSSRPPKPKPTPNKKDTVLNGLQRFQISSALLEIDETTLFYWRSLGIPLYLFVFITEGSGNEFACFYKRYAHILTKSKDPTERYFEGFFRANEGMNFFAFADSERRVQGFARDLLIDHVRCSYSKGALTYPDPSCLGLKQFGKDNVFPDLFEEYRDELLATYKKTQAFVKAKYGIE